jgi:hypothetical protein
MGQNTEHKAITVSMAWMTLLLLQNILHACFGHIIVFVYCEPKPLKHMPQELWKKRRERGDAEMKWNEIKWRSETMLIIIKITQQIKVLNVLVS